MKRRTMLASLAAGATALTRPSAMMAQAAASGSGASFKLGLVTYNLAKDWDLDTIIANCSKTGFQGVELRTTHAHKVEVNLNKAQRAEVKKKFEDSPIELIGLGSAFDFHTPDQDKLKRDIEATKEYIVLAHDVGGGGVKVRPNGLPDGIPKEKTIAQIGSSLREIGAFASDYGIQIRVEMHGSKTSEPPNMRAIMDAADHPNVGLCWNSNALDVDGQGWDYNFNLCKDKIFSAHMRDLYDEEYPYRKLYQGLKGVGFTGFTMAEIQESSDPIRVMNYYRGMWKALQNLL